MKLEKINDKFYISISQLIQLGFDYPDKGTKGVYKTLFKCDTSFYKFHEKKEGWMDICISPYLTDCGKIHVNESDFYIEFSTINFKYSK